MTMLYVVAIWEVVRTIPDILERITKGLAELLIEALGEPEGLLPLIICLLFLCALIGFAKFCVWIIDELLLRDSGPPGLGLN